VYIKRIGEAHRVTSARLNLRVGVPPLGESRKSFCAFFCNTGGSSSEDAGRSGVSSFPVSLKASFGKVSLSSSSGDFWASFRSITCGSCVQSLIKRSNEGK
jgi:hypothetical protein